MDSKTTIKATDNRRVRSFVKANSNGAEATPSDLKKYVRKSLPRR